MSRAGFTLIEIITVIAIVAVLAAATVFSLGPSRMKARDTKRVASIQELSGALELYFQGTGIYPTAITAGQPLAANGLLYMNAVPSNPTPRTDGGCPNKDFLYERLGSTYRITFCLGGPVPPLSAGTSVCMSGLCEPCPLCDF